MIDVILRSAVILAEPVYEIEVEIKNSDGLHMRPAMEFVDVASQFDCEITVSNEDTTVDGKSIMQMTMLAATCGTKLKVRADGCDAEKAVAVLGELIGQEFFSGGTKASAKGRDV
jgi:phosphocarrier protein